MEQNFEDIKSKTTCPDCSGKEMVFGFRSTEGEISKKTSFLGMDAYKRATGEVMIICKNCGLVIKSYAMDPKKL